MRVVAGKYKGKNLASPKDDRIRPTTTRIKETLFNVLQGYVDDAVVLDLFAGSGALGIECISRGAREVTFVDRSKDAIELINRNLQGINGNYKVVNGDYSSALRNAYVVQKKYDLIFIDPPYATELGELAINAIIELDILSRNGVIVFEHGAEKQYLLDDSRFKQRTKKMCTITAEFISHKSVALMAGSFDPFTRGHEAVLDEALCSFDEVYVACLINPDKTYRFNDAQRLEIVKRVCEGKKGAHALFSRKYAVEVAKEVGAQTLVRGVRSDDDVPYEREMADFNKAHGYDTLFITPDGYRELSSTTVRQQLDAGDYRNVPAVVAGYMQSQEFSSLE